MSNHTIIRRSAQAELIDLVDYIAMDDPVAAERVRDAALASITHLANNPRVGRPYKVSTHRPGRLA